MRTSKIRLFALITIVAAVGALVVVPAALAQGQGGVTEDPSSAQYDPPIPDGEVAAGLGGGGTGAAADDGGGLGSNIGSLPFTGMDLIIVAGVAFILTGTGFALRRLSTPRGPHV
jgi:hypothetical protein